MTETMAIPRLREITRADYLAHGVKDRSSPFTAEKRWFQYADLLGVVLFDNVDHDWSFVALRQDDGEWLAFDLGVSHATPDSAIAALDAALQRGP